MTNKASNVGIVKDIFNMSETVDYTGLAKSTIYKLVHNRAIPCHKPNGKLLYFRKEDLDNYLTRNRIKPASEIEEEAVNYLTNREN